MEEDDDILDDYVVVPPEVPTSNERKFRDFCLANLKAWMKSYTLKLMSNLHPGVLVPVGFGVIVVIARQFGVFERIVNRIQRNNEKNWITGDELLQNIPKTSKVFEKCLTKTFVDANGIRFEAEIRIKIHADPSKIL